MNSHRGECRTIVYIHGIGDQHPEGELKFQWDKALLDFDAGERTRMAYWARSSDAKTPPLTARVPKSFRTLARGGPAGTEPYSDFLALCVSELTDDPAEAETLVTMGHGFLASQSMKSGVVRFPANSRRTRAFDWIPDDITRAFLWLFLRDVHGYLHVPERREEMQRTFLDRILPGGGPFVVIGHSLGSVIAYDVLRSLEGQDVSVPLFVTLGSPIGMGPVTRYLTDSGGPLRRPVCVRQWLNVSDPLDVVAADHQLKDNLGNDASVEDITEDIKGGIHLALPYLRHPPVREAVTAETDTALFQFVAPVAIVRNLSRLLEGAGRSDRVPVLIELSEDSNMPGVDLEERRTYTLKAIAEVTRKDLEDPELNLRRLVRFVAADLTRFEAERLASLIPLHPEKPSGAPLHRLWHNSVKNALLQKSAETVHAGPAHRTYRAEGAEIHWAVLDTGCDPDHPHFATHSTIVEEIDCTGRIPVRGPGRAQDRNGHGTHVAGIIAGEWKNGASEVRATAPKARLHIYKVLRDDGRGDDASIIMALDDIAAQNAKHGGLRIHGVNLSLGGRFEPSIFGCGFSPLCAELRRLWMGGVLVVLAAGNEGYLSIEWKDSTIEANMPISIGDPANLEEAIAVGSTHRERPHLYGTSFFSSRGPTADGRQKPDLVAPGEKIVSCRAGGRLGDIDDLYVAMSGTSMAAPHVSGLLAAFLSARPEFKGYPERVKRILLGNCTDLGRVKEHQGAGLPNLGRMLLNT